MKLNEIESRSVSLVYKQNRSIVALRKIKNPDANESPIRIVSSALQPLLMQVKRVRVDLRAQFENLVLLAPNNARVSRLTLVLDLTFCGGNDERRR